MHRRSPCAYRATLTPEPEGGFTLRDPLMFSVKLVI